MKCIGGFDWAYRLQVSWSNNETILRQVKPVTLQSPTLLLLTPPSNAGISIQMEVQEFYSLELRQSDDRGEKRTCVACVIEVSAEGDGREDA